MGRRWSTPSERNMQAKPRLEWRPQARADLLKIVAYIADDNPDPAQERPMKHWIFFSLVCIASAASAAQEVNLGCKHLRVVLDARLSPDMVKHEWRSGQPRSESPATLELVGCKGQLLDRFALEAPLAKLDPVPVRGASNPTYLVSVDLTFEFGSYSGPVTIPIQVIRDRLVAAVVQVSDKRVEPIYFPLTLKSAWKRVSTGKVDDFLLVRCHPADPAGNGFVTSYSRYSPSRQGWKVKVRTEEGLWESDGEFPRRNKFPQR